MIIQKSFTVEVTIIILITIYRYIDDHPKESSITEEVEAELRPASRGSSHTPLLPSKKVADDSNVNNAR